VVNTSPGIIPGLEPYIEAGRAAAYLSISRKTVLKRPARATCRRTLIGSICYQNATKFHPWVIGLVVGGRPEQRPRCSGA